MHKMTTPTPVAPAITKAASKQTYYTIRILADRDRTAEAYKAYAYFRWVDDTLDADVTQWARDAQERAAFLRRQKALLETCYRGESFPDPTVEEQMLIELVQHDSERNSGLQSYLRNMMRVMEFDAHRRGRLISQAELSGYTRWLAVAVTEAMHYFIGHDCDSPRGNTCYLAVTGAHIAHMLRDTFDDVQAGYYNIPQEVLEAGGIEPHDVHSPAYRAWVCSRVQLARRCFRAGRRYLARVQEPRCRLAGLAYTARFEWLLDTIEKEDYVLRPQYPERKSFVTGLRMGLLTCSAVLQSRKAAKETTAPPIIPRPLRER
jgi:phytoene/squalene synthetase